MQRNKDNQKQKRFYYSEKSLDNPKFYFDKVTNKNNKQTPHASLQIGESKSKHMWSRMPTTTADVRDKKQYIFLKNLSKDGKKIKLRRQILTSSTSSRLNQTKRPRLEQSDVSKIKAFISKYFKKIKK